MDNELKAIFNNTLAQIKTYATSKDKAYLKTLQEFNARLTTVVCNESTKETLEK